VPVGELVGIHVRSEAVTVVAFDEVLGGGVRDAGVKIGDRLLEVNGRRIREVSEVPDALGSGERVRLTLVRGSKKLEAEVPLQQTDDGPKLGLYLRQGISGIGTVTWYDPDSGAFGALGHGVSTPKGSLLAMTSGNAYHARIQSVLRGKSGEPGQLRGASDAAFPCGEFFRNTPQGVFGITRERWLGEPLPVAGHEEMHPGPATIRSTVSGSSVQEYSVEILKIYPKDRSDNRNLLIRITDPILLNTTGGIVQGMSGSPIIQDGKLVGAVTHVLVNDPTRGYGIFIENMLDAAG
jgi:stage IV sporulation protein B